ncbi:hypothetical protein Erwinia_phage_Aioli_00014 [Erwinia phage Aioli]|nr:hypothetical protein Erwinia_phage_Aioli_00014 [Erwinia phage Aioli]
MPCKIRKHSAKVLSATMKDGDVYHYVLVGGKWFYNGSKNVNISSGAAKDGFWFDPIAEIITRSCGGYTTKTLNDVITYMGEEVSRKVYMREWESNTYYGNEAPF